MTKTMIEPGTYRLMRDVQNPDSDRRFKNDWRYKPLWRAGTELLVVGRMQDAEELIVESDSDEVKAKLRARKFQYTSICLVGHRWAHESVGPGHEQYAALVAAMEPIPESHEAMFTRLGVHGGFERWLVTSGKLTPAEFEKLWDEYYAEPDPDEAVARVVTDVIAEEPSNPTAGMDEL